MVAKDRGQVLLLGGLAIAIVFLTAIPLSNSLIVSESASSSETVSDIDRVATKEVSVNRGVRTLIAEVNTSNRTALNQALQDFSRHYTNVSGQQNGVYVNASLNVTASRGGVVNSGSATNFEPYDGNSPGSQFDWDVVDDATEITEFTMNLTKINGNQNNGFRVNITNASGSQWELRTHDPGGADPVVETRNATGSWQTVCTGSTPIQLDIQAGTCTTDAGSPTATTVSFETYTATVDGPYYVRFQNGNRAGGDYRLAGIGTFPNGNANIVIVPALDLTYVGPDASYDRTILVNETS